MMNPQTRIPPSAQQMKAANASMSPGAIPTPGGMGGVPGAMGAVPPGMPPVGAPDDMGAPGGQGSPGAPDIGQLIGQLAMVIQAQTGRPPTPQQLQAALVALMGGGGAPGMSPGMPPGGAPPVAGGPPPMPMGG